MNITNADSIQFSMFKDSLARKFIAKPGVSDEASDPAELDDFVLYLAGEAWVVLGFGEEPPPRGMHKVRKKCLTAPR
ncbi:hypothetical protein BDW22DRAFT_1364262 [Trametopsis cervina]|nr:hypothetical protein BDW22DRAFT_1364262 [Trametopsis cervina]